MLDADTFVAACGGGLYATRDAGRSWIRLDEDMPQSYFQAILEHEGRWYAAGQTLPPTLPMGSHYDHRDVNADLFESADGGETFASVSYPGKPTEFVYAWTVAGDRVLAGTTEGRVLAREDDEWVTNGHIAAWIRSLGVG